MTGWPYMLPGDRDHIEHRFADSVVYTDSFPHLIIRNVLPGDVYARMLRPPMMPSRWQWWRAAIDDTYRSYVKRFPPPLALAACARAIAKRQIAQPLFEIRKAGGHSSPSLDRFVSLWGWVRDYVDLVDQLTAEKFKPFLDRPVVPSFVVMCRRLHWEIAPHVHNSRQAIQSMIYCAPDETKKLYGTIIYKPKPGAIVPFQEADSTPMMKRDDLNAIKVLPYLPNTLVSWVNTPVSFHSSPSAGWMPRDYIFSGFHWQT